MWRISKPTTPSCGPFMRACIRAVWDRVSLHPSSITMRFAKWAPWPDESVFIDDMRENVLAAASLGIYAFHFTSAEDLLAEFSRLNLWTT